MAFSWLKAATTAFTFKTLLRHMIMNLRMELFEALLQTILEIVLPAARGLQDWFCKL